MNQPQTTNIVDTFFVIDLDRCLLDTDKVHKILEETVAQLTPISLRKFADARTQDEAAGLTFDSYEYVRKMLQQYKLTPQDWVKIERRFIADTKDVDLLNPYASELLELLAQRHHPCGIITYGVEAWQLAKLEASGLFSIPHEVTRIKEKGRLLRDWTRKDTGMFFVPPGLGGMIARSIVFLDDKAVSFTDIPPGVQGIRVLPAGGRLLPAQQGPLPPEVVEVEGLRGAIDLLFSA